MEPVLVLDAKGEILLFKGPRALERYVEAIDVQNGEYGQCWDSDGQLLRLETGPARTWLGLQEAVFVVPTGALDEEGLRTALLRFLVSRGHESAELHAADTSKLVASAAERAGWS